ncbi:MAG: hypothetical protein IH861_10380 [Chloroflexi bacterium]|nr:hypothetical protein [Chloroflexota bacterium]
MPTSPSQPMSSKEEIVSSLKARAEELWGARRASELQNLLDQTAEHVWQISQHPPDDEEEPGFYF